MQRVSAPRFNDLFRSCGTVIFNQFVCFISVNHLSKYLETRASLDLGSGLHNKEISFSVHIAPNPGNFISLADSESLRNVVDTYWRNNRPLELYYTFKKKKEK